MNYEQGLNKLGDIVQRQEPEAFSDFDLFRSRLIDCLERRRRYGQSSNNDVERYEILDGLIEFTSNHFALSFIDLCRSDEPLNPLSQARPTPTPPANLYRGVWEGGSKILVKNTAYVLHEPIEKQWSSDHSALQQHARALEMDTGRMTWLKQIQVYQATETANAWKTALEKEMRLINDLTSHLLQRFPAYLSFEATTHAITLVYSAAPGESWSQYFKPSTQSFDKRSIRTLLSSAISLCATLKPLHAKKLAHRSLTPDKIFLTGGRNALLQDLGLATWTYEHGEGPDLYRAPEQNGAHIRLPDPRTDVYQLGMILYHFITGTMPTSPQQVLPLRSWNSELSEDQDTVLQKAIPFRLAERWRNASDLSSALKRVL